MAYSRTYFTVKTNGQTLVVSATAPGGGSSALHLTSAVSSAVTQPYTITSDTSFYVLDELAGDYIVSCKQPDGSELFGKAVKLQPGDPKTVEPAPSSLQLAADDTGITTGLLISGAIAETFPRFAICTNSSNLTSGRLALAAIALRRGMTVTNISFMSATTALSGGENQWFALYNSSGTLLGQCADVTTEAWAANEIKTLALASPVVTAYSGLYYLGIMVKASSAVPTLAAIAVSALTTGRTPKLCALADSSLTATAPATLGTLSNSVAYPYAYVS